MGKVLLVPELQQGAHFPEFGFVFEACYFICFTARWWREYYFSIDLFGSGNEPMDHIEAVLKRIKNGEMRFCLLSKPDTRRFTLSKAATGLCRNPQVFLEGSKLRMLAMGAAAR